MATKTIPDLDLAAAWLRHNAMKAEALALCERRNLEASDDSTPYARSVRELAEAHEEAAAVYRRRIAELS